MNTQFSTLLNAFIVVKHWHSHIQVYFNSIKQKYRVETFLHFPCLIINCYYQGNVCITVGQYV